VIKLQNDFGLALNNDLPPLGAVSRSLKILSNVWNPDRTQLTLEISGVPGRSYDLEVWNPWQIQSVDGATLTTPGKIHIEIPATESKDYSHRTVAIHFAKP
jgi:hypothetical protein